ncbi:CC0125/CC1285 family lipoprotein [Caulobacter sp. ErkDOM-E]|uniref:CC0125/CC1285 family lipoprotein n=1 Tax=Caulobacter sp. ErkDOM-E TaxID=3402778 RepID=UPI003AF42D7E
MQRLAGLALSLLLLSGCASAPTLYAARTASAGVGYSEFRLEPGRYRVTFQGGPGAPVEQVSDYALLRAAELAVRDGYDWFRVSDRLTTSTGAGSGPRLSIGGGSSRYGGHSSIGLGLGTSFDLGPGPTVTSSLEVVFGRGAAPRDADVYVAQAIIRSVGYGRSTI